MTMPSGEKSNKSTNQYLPADKTKVEIPRRTALVVLAVILCIGTFARFYRLGDKSLWLDEIMSARLARMDTPFEVIREVASYDAHPPLFPLLHYLFMRIGDSEFIARMPSALFGVLTILMMYLFVSRLSGRAAGLSASALLALSAYNIYFSQEARHYSLAMLLPVTLSWVLLVIIDSKDKPPTWTWIAYALTGAALLYTFAMGILLIIAHWTIFLLRARKNRPIILRGLITQVCIGLAFLPWLPSLLDAQRRVAFIAEMEGASPAPGTGDMIKALGHWIFGATFQPFGNLFILGAPAVIIFALALIAIYYNRRKGLVISLCLTILPMIIFLALPITRAHQFDPKHLAFIAPFFTALPGVIIVVASRKTRYAAGLILICVAIVNIGLASGYYDASFQKDTWPAAAEYITGEGGGEFILVTPDRGAPQALDRYYSGELEIRAATVGPFVPMNAELNVDFEQVWLISGWNEVLSPTQGLIEWFEANTRKVSEEYFLNKPPQMYPGYPLRIIRCALYERGKSSSPE